MNGFRSGIIALVLAAAGTFLAGAPAAAEQSIDAMAVAEHLDKGKYSSREIKTYMKGLKGKEIIAAGKIDDIHGQPKQTAKVVVHVNIPGRDTLFVVDVHMPQNDADKLHKGDRVLCKGSFRRYNPWTLNGIVTEGSCGKQ